MIRSLPHRGIDEETCRKFNYQVAKLGDKVIEIASYVGPDGSTVGQKIRDQKPEGKKKFLPSRGNMRQVGLWGKHLWSPGGKMLVITEGELDAMSVSQGQDNKWPVVSLPAGAAHAEAAIKHDYEYVNSFATVVLCFDMDEPGQEAALRCAEILPPGKAKICKLPRKDANEMVVAGEADTLRNCIWQSSAFRPDGILHGSEIEKTERGKVKVMTLPWKGLTKELTGYRSGEIWLWTSGSGSGKSTFLREIAYHNLKQGRPVGMLMLEEAPSQTMDDIISLQMNTPIRKIDAERELRQLCIDAGEDVPELYTDYDPEEYARNREWWNSLPVFVYNHSGVKEAKAIISRLEYMIVGLGCEIVILDHITHAVTAMMGEMENDSERLVIDALMDQLASLRDRTGAHIDIVSQLKKPSNGRQYEEGDRICLGDLRGSRTLETVPNVILAGERNRQHLDPNIRNKTLIRVLKDRFTGVSGIVGCLEFNTETGRTIECDYTLDADGFLTSTGPSSPFGGNATAPEDVV